MKIDRILEIIIFLLNHDNVPASLLAGRFHVSVRTIQRDIVNISAIGIPVYANGGKYGGYSILPTYKMKNTMIKSDEQQMIIKALESLSTSYANDTLKSLIEKYNAIYRTCIHIEVHFNQEDAGLMAEYFPDCPAERLTAERSRIFIDVPAKERLWKALLLSFGDKVTVVGPEEYKNELIATARNFLSNYDI